LSTYYNKKYEIAHDCISQNKTNNIGILTEKELLIYSILKYSSNDFYNDYEEWQSFFDYIEMSNIKYSNLRFST